MKIFEVFRIALSSLRTNKLRSSLTILGIIVGIFSIISISTIIAMMQTSIEDGVSALGKDTFQFQKWPAVQMSRAERMALVRNRRDITLEESTKLAEVLVDAKSVGSELWRFGRRVKYKSEETNPNIQMAGITLGAFPNNNWNVKDGREFTQNEINSYSDVIVLGADVSKALFKNINPIGQEVKIDGHKLEVIGILESTGDFFGQSQDNFIIVPITTFQSFYGRRSNSVNITIMAHSKEEYQNLIETAEGHFRKIRKVEAGKPSDFSIRTNEAILNQINEMTASVRIGAFVIGGIALLAAGIGIMNIMLVSVTERTREIGIRKAIGAKRMNVLLQFLTEAISLSVLGGLVGIVLGVVLGNVVGSMLQATSVIPFDWIAIGVTMCVLVGIVFGTYPAYKASNLDPIEALRYE